MTGEDYVTGDCRKHSSDERLAWSRYKATIGRSIAYVWLFWETNTDVVCTHGSSHLVAICGEIMIMMGEK